MPTCCSSSSAAVTNTTTRSSPPTGRLPNGARSFQRHSPAARFLIRPSPVFVQQIPERYVAEFLKIGSSRTRMGEQFDCPPCLGVKLNALAGHRRAEYLP